MKCTIKGATRLIKGVSNDYLPKEESKKLNDLLDILDNNVTRNFEKVNRTKEKEKKEEKTTTSTNTNVNVDSNSTDTNK